MKKLNILNALTLAVFAATSAKATVIVGGSYSGNGGNANIKQALIDLGVSFIDMSGTETPSPVGLGAGDIIFTGNDGSGPSFVDYTSFLNSGGIVASVGGSNLDAFRSWMGQQFSLTDTGIGWHTDGAWTKTVNTTASAGLPGSYVFQNNLATYHMMGFLAGVNTTLYGVNGEGVSVGALRSYANGGFFDALSLDIGMSTYTSAADYQNFVKPWVQSALNLRVTPAPEPSTLALAGLGSLSLLALRKRK